MKQSDIEVKYLMYDPFDEKTVSKLESYEEFKVDFGVSKKEVITYIILLYDMNTQLRREVPYLNQRKIIAAELAGFKKNKDGKFKKEYEDVMLGLNGTTEAAISKYIRLFANPKYISLVYYWSILSAEFFNISSSTESKDFKNTIANIEKLEAKINDHTQVLFGGDETMNIRRALYESVEKENLKLRPEDIANATEEELETILENPYGDYKPDKLKFKSHQ